MLDIKVESKGDRLVVEGLVKLADAYPAGIDRVVNRAAKGTHIEAHKLLSGQGAKGRNVNGQFERAFVAPGGYPVPIRTGHLRNRLNFIGPGRSKSADGSMFQTGVHEALVFDSARYSVAIHDGTGSSKSYGPRPFITDGFQAFWGGSDREFGEEIDQTFRESGL